MTRGDLRMMVINAAVVGIPAVRIHVARTSRFDAARNQSQMRTHVCGGMADQAHPALMRGAQHNLWEGVMRGEG